MNQIKLLQQSVDGLLRAFTTILRPAYLGYFAIILMLNLITFIVITAFVALLLQVPLAALIDLFDLELSALASTGINIIFVIAGIVTSVLLFPTTSIIVSSPVYDRMTGKLLHELGFPEGQHSSALQSFADSITFELKKGAISIFVFFLTFLLNLIPILGQIGFVTGVFGNIIVINGIDTFIPSFDRQQRRFRDVLGFVLKNPGLWPILALLGTVNATPLINLVTIPLSVTAGVFMYASYYRS